METKTITMTDKQLTRFRVLTQLIDNTINAPTAAQQLGLSERHTVRLKQCVAKQGAEALIHGNTGKKSNRAINEQTKENILTLAKEQYRDFGPTLLQEKLKENHAIALSNETIRTLLTKEQLWKPKKRKGSVEYRRKRERKERYGDMQQFDGSYHDWFEGRAETKKQCLLVAIDDATGMLTKAQFSLHGGEGIADVFPFWMDYLKDVGAPCKLYVDRFSTYKIHNPSPADLAVKTRFERAMSALGIETITAHSPQAKGRVERVNGTLQDRLVKELRLAHIDTIEAANTFLTETFIPAFNAKFGVVAQKEGDVHRTLTDSEIERLPHLFSRQVTRLVGNDFTVMFHTRIFQISKEQTVTVCKRDQVIIEEHIDGSIHLLHVKRERYLSFEELDEKPKRVKTAVIPATKRVHRPAADHPWRKAFLPQKNNAPASAVH